MCIFNLKIYKFSLKMYIFNLKTKNFRCIANFLSLKGRVFRPDSPFVFSRFMCTFALIKWYKLR